MRKPYLISFPGSKEVFVIPSFAKARTGKVTRTSGLIFRSARQNMIFILLLDGQLGGIMKVYREWRISGDNDWMKRIYPMVKKSMDYCIQIWDPGHKGIVEEPHHNTYDIEFWGA
jgi:hypothetical protein